MGSESEASSEKWGSDVFQTSQNNKIETTKEKRPPEIGIYTISSYFLSDVKIRHSYRTNTVKTSF